MNFNKDSRNPAFDGLRAVAVMLVFLVHTHLVSIPGGLGVDIFFVLSGYLITRLLLSQIQKRGDIDLITFFVHRFARLAPALVVMCVLVEVGYLLTRHENPGDKIIAGLLALTYTANIYMTVFSKMIDPFSHTWSLAQEEQFYLLWPFFLLFALGREVRPKSLVILLSFLVAVSAIAWFYFGAQTPFNPLLKFGGLLAGSAAAIATSKSRWSSSWIGYLSLAIFVAIFILESFGILSRQLTSPITWICSTFVILMLEHRESQLKKALSFRPLVYLGQISYGFYLWHYPLLSMCASLNLEGTVFVAVALLLTLAVSALSFRFIERPITLRRDLISSRAKRLLIRNHVSN